jgi:putative hydrolase of the HAD superfamily
VPGGSRLQRDALAFQMAEDLGVDRIKFADIVRSTFDARVRATMGGLSETISELARRVGGCPTSQQVAVAAEQRLTFSRNLLSDTYSAPHLINLKSRGYQLGIVTDCSAEMPLSWTSTWPKDVVDVVAFSCELGVRKPNPEMYLSATRRLNVQPDECLFIGDGDSDELLGAYALGMSTKMPADPNLLEADRRDDVRKWHGAVIKSLADLLDDSIL